MGISKNIKTITLLLLFFAGKIFAYPVELKQLQVHATQDETQLIFNLTGNVTNFHAFALDNPARVVVDIPNARFIARPSRSLLANTIVDDIRTGVRDKATLRMVFDLLSTAKPRVYLVPPKFPHGYRLVINIYPVKKTSLMPRTLELSNINKKASPKAAVTMAQPTRNIVIVIDPGHGGKDPGATGPHRVLEKNVVLAISRDLATALKRIPGIKASLTRNGDYYLTLRQRLQIARRDKGDMFVAIHADALFHNAGTQGATVFALSERGASSEAARWLAEKENYSELGGASLKGKDNILRSVLIDLSQTATISASLQLGAAVLRQLDTITQLRHDRVEQARFVVLKSPDILSILVETGFISNPMEERRLANPTYQRRLANAIANGINNYFMQNPPQDTLFALRQRAHKYCVKRGETVASIAREYQVSPMILKKLNGLTANHLQSGYSVLIPPNTVG